MKWRKYTIETTTAAEDFISAALAELGIEGIEINNNTPLTAADTAKMFIDFLPELPQDDGSSQVSFYLDPEDDTPALFAKVEAAIEEQRLYTEVGSGRITASETEDVDWINNWKEFFHAFVIPHPNGGRDILIKPTWETVEEADADKLLIEIDPGISFGTGKHETTRLCIEALMAHVKEGDALLDVGCGSGILSIVGKQLGAGRLVGTDIDEDCITSTCENLAVNGIAAEEGAFICGNLIDDAALQKKVGEECYDIVVANILADVIIPLAPVIPSRLKEGGIFIASGIIDFKEEAVAAAITAAGMTILNITHQGEWVGITARK